MGLGVLTDPLAVLDEVIERDIKIATLQVDITDLQRAYLTRRAPVIATSHRYNSILGCTLRPSAITAATSSAAVAGSGRCAAVGSFADSAGFQSIQSQRFAVAKGRTECCEFSVSSWLHRLAHVRTAASQLAIVTASRTPRSATVAGRHRFPSDYRGTTMAKAYQPLISQDSKGMLDCRRAYPLKVAQLGDRQERLVPGQLPGDHGVSQPARSLLPARPGVRRVCDKDGM